jgi:hypothetical protein
MASNVKTAKFKRLKILAQLKFSGLSRSLASSLGKGRVNRGLFFPACPTSNIHRPFIFPCSPPYS